MLAFLPSIAFQASLPPSAWRGDTGFRHDDQTSAAQVVAYEQREGRLLDLAAELVAILAGLHASALLWVTFKRSLAARYGPPARVPLDLPAYIIGEDGEGGYLILFPDNPTGSQTENATMKAPAEATARELKEAGAWFAANMNAQPATAAKAEIGGYIVLERSTEDKGGASKLAGHYPDQRDAVTHARLYPATAEQARESGQNAWAEVHPVTKDFYDGITQDPAQGDRLSSMAALYSHAREIEGGAIIPATEHEANPSKERNAMNDQTQDTDKARWLPDLDQDRRDDLAKRIDALQQDAEAIVTDRGNSAAGHYQQHREAFDAKQGELAGPEKEAQGHEYAAFLAERVGTYKQGVAQEDTAAALFKEADARKEIAAIVRGGNEPEKQTDPSRSGEPLYSFIDPDTGNSGDPTSAEKAVEQYASRANFLVTPVDGDPDLWKAGSDKLAMIADDGDYVMSANSYKELAEQLTESGDLRRVGGPERGPDNDPNKPTGRDAEGSTAERAEGGKYDALRQSEADARALTQQRELAASKSEPVAVDSTPVQARAPEPEDEDKKIRGGGDNGPTRPELGHNIRPEVGIGPGGTVTYTTTQSERIDPQTPEADPRPMHPDTHAAREPSAAERLEATLKELDAPPDERNAAREITARDEGEASSKRQDAERRDAAGESRPEDAGAVASPREQTASERLETTLKQLDAEPQPSGQDAGRDAASFGRGMM
jgi:hypothetical protein